MAGREVREYTNLTDPKDKKLGKGKDKIDDEDITFQRMVAKMQEVAGERGGYLHGRGGTTPFLFLLCVTMLFVLPHLLVLSVALILLVSPFVPFLKFKYAALDSDDLLYLKEQMEAEEDAERLLRRTEKRAFAAFKRAASLADSTPASVPLPLRVEPKPKSGIRQHDLLRKVVEIKPKRPRSEGNQQTPASNHKPDGGRLKENEQASSGPKKVEEFPSSGSHEAEVKPKVENSAGGLLGLAYASSDDDDE